MFEITKSTIKLGDTLVKNRTVSSPVSINMANTDGTVTKNIISYFSNLAMNDVGMVTKTADCFRVCCFNTLFVVLYIN